ncbi:hypothetical protein [Mollivirus kamchatka]|nr:hypothetical protein [Mollivirus kamchatka]
MLLTGRPRRLSRSQTDSPKQNLAKTLMALETVSGLVDGWLHLVFAKAHKSQPEERLRLLVQAKGQPMERIGKDKF